MTDNAVKSNLKTLLHIETNVITDIEKGLTKEQIRISGTTYGENKLSRIKRRPFLSKFISNLKDPIIRILIGALVINTVFMMKNINWAETLGIACAVLVAAFVSTVSEHGSEKAFDKLNERTGRSKVSVIREGVARSLDEEDIVAGDVILIGAGMTVPADCVIFNGSVCVDQSSLTGESSEIKKYQHFVYGNKIDAVKIFDTASESSKIYKGCLCTKGECFAVVCRVGEQTEYGKIARELAGGDRKSPLKERLSELAKTISYIGYIAAFMIMAAYLFNAIVVDSSWNAEVILFRIKDIRFLISKILNAVTLGVSVIVVAVPEGLPMMITVVLSSNMKKMLKSGVLVRKMVGIETAGCMNILFTDKTGTLTAGNMSVRKIVTASGEFSTATELSNDASNKEIIPLISDFLVGNTYRSPTENALINFCKGIPKENAPDLIDKLKFNSDNKYSACLYKTSGTIRCAVLGAAEKLLSMCEYQISENGRVKIFDSYSKERIIKIMDHETSCCARVIVLALTGDENWSEICCNKKAPLIFYSLISIRDELRKDITSSVKETLNAGVHVIMITGDNEYTARAVASEAGIINDDHYISLSGEKLRTMSDEELTETLPKLAVVSRSLPSDKQRLVEVARKMGLVSGMTGDGINDAPSLKAADVGFAMGSGSDVAKEAADIILTNNSFVSITKSILYGRCIFESIRKFISFQLIMNLCALGVSLIGPFIGEESPITVIQMLWVNIIMDTLGGLAFAGEIPLSEYMRRPPINRDEKILTSNMVSQIICCGLYSLTLSIFFLKSQTFKNMIGLDNGTYFYTCFFAFFIFCGLFNSFNARAPVGGLLSHISGNKAFISILIFVTAVQLTIIYFGGEIFRCTPVMFKDLAVCFILSSTVIPIDQLRKYFGRSKNLRTDHVRRNVN